ncbi:MAG: amidohydrolase family protein [Desulfococcaceae bacterium]
MKKEIWVQAGWLIDGRGGPVQENVLLHIADGTVREIRNIREADTNLPEMLNLSDCTLVPGLIDSHLHLFMSGTGDLAVREKQLNAGFEEMKPVISGHLEQLLGCGVLAVRDGGDYAGHSLQYRNLYMDKMPVRIMSPGRAWRKDGRYGRLIGRPPGKGRSLAEAIAAESAGIDHVKIVQSGINSLKEFGKQTPPQFDLDELTQAVAAAHSLGLKVMVHCNGNLPVASAIQAGCDSVEHGFFMGEENLKRMADRGVFWVPTAITMKAYAQHLAPGSLEAGTARRTYLHQAEQISLARELGVSIALGTDAGSLGVFHGLSVREELKILMQSGFSVSEAVKCATCNGAGLLGISAEAGRIASGYPAIFLAVKGKPSDLPENLKQVRIFRKQGFL